MHFIKVLRMSPSSLNLMRRTGLMHEINEELDMNMQTLVESDFTRYPSMG